MSPQRHNGAARASQRAARPSSTSRNEAMRATSDDNDDPRLTRFRAWCDARGIVTNDDAIQVKSLPCGAEDDALGATPGRRHYAVFARRRIEEGETLFEIPKTSLLCAANSERMRAFVERGALGGGLALNCVAMGELMRDDDDADDAEDDFWSGFKSILPLQGERSLPMFWDEEDRARTLRGTELAEHLAEDDEAFEEDFETCVDAIGAEETRKMGLTVEKFKAVASMAASRAFFVGGKYQEALVPCADMFNHKTGENSVAVFGMEDEDEDEDDANGSDQDEDDANDALVIKTVKEVKAGEELYNTFGEQSNASLLHKYGFCEEHNVDTATVTLDVSLFENVFGEKTMHECYEALKLNDELNEELIEFFENGKYYEITAKGGVEAEFRDVVRVVGRALRRLEVDVPSDRSMMNAILLARLKRYGDLGDLNADLHEDVSGGRSPAGGGVVGERAARLVRRQEVDLILANYN